MKRFTLLNTPTNNVTQRLRNLATYKAKPFNKFDNNKLILPENSNVVDLGYYMLENIDSFLERTGMSHEELAYSLAYIGGWTFYGARVILDDVQYVYAHGTIIPYHITYALEANKEHIILKKDFILSKRMLKGYIMGFNRAKIEANKYLISPITESIMDDSYQYRLVDENNKIHDEFHAHYSKIYHEME